MTLAVDAGGERVLADVGFGAAGLLLPVPFAAAEARQFAWAYRLVDDAGAFLLQSRRGDEPWENLYAFGDAPQLPVDYEPANWYTSTHPASRFTQVLTAQRLAPDRRRTLRNLEYSEETGDAVATRTLDGDDAILAVLAGEFGLVFPAGTRFAFDRGAG
jgi:N-hydroxyarylamine O-acetyltransferase